tara:strand:- start:48 stop:305 length:258 start_codon:yes stop_codon:yes gene_type:complete
MTEWRDATSYSQSDKERIPKTFEYRTQQIRIIISCGHIDCPGEWVMHCRELDMKCKGTGAESKEEAQNRALEIVRERLEGMLEGI